MAKNQELSMQQALEQVAEALRLQSVMPNVYAYVPHAKQEQFHTSKKKRKLYIGGNRSGKTTAGVIEDIWWATKKHPFRELPKGPLRIRVIGVDFSNGIEKILLPQFKRWCPASELKGGSWESAYLKQERTLHFANGSFIEFMSYDQDLDKFAGTSRHLIHFDEEPPEAIYTENVARLIDTGGSLIITMTPVEGMTWVFDTIYEPGKLGSDLIEVIEVSMDENPHLDQAEVKEFLGSLSEDEREARGKGKFIQMGGLIYKQFDPQPGGMHVLDVDDYVPPKDYTWVVSLDHGFNNPTAVLWHSISPDGQVVTFYELYMAGLTLEQYAAKIHAVNKMFGRRPDYYIADPSIRNTSPTSATSIQQEYIKFGIAFTLGNNDVKAGIIRMARYMTMNPRNNGEPLWHVTKNCTMLIKELSRYRWKTYSSKKMGATRNAFDEPHKKDDHAADSLRYFIMSRPDLGAGMGPSSVVYTADDLNENGYSISEATIGMVAVARNHSVNPVGEYAQINWHDEQDDMGSIW